VEHRMRRTLLTFALSVLCSAFLFAVVMIPDFLWLYGGIVCILAAAAVGYALVKNKDSCLLPLGLGVLFAFALILIWNGRVLLPAEDWHGKSANLCLTVCETPYVGEGYVTFEAKVTRIGSRDCAIRVKVNAEEGFETKLGEELTVFGSLYKPNEQQKTYDRARGILMRAEIREITDRKTPDRLPLSLIPAYIAQFLGDTLSANLSEDVSGLLRALLIGDKAKMSTGLKLDLRRTGLSHVAAVSGLHVSFLVSFLMLVCRRKAGMFLSVPILVLFALMTGASPSVLRAVIMQFVWLLSFPLKREADAPTAMGFAAVCILCLNPYAAGDIGLWLSFGSTAGITLWASKLTGFFLSCLPKYTFRPAKAAVNFLSASLAATLSSQIFVLPLSLLYFGEMSLISPIANLLLLGAVQAMFVLGILCLAAALLVPAFLMPIVWVTEAAVWCFTHLVSLLAEFPFSYVSADGYVILAIASLYLFIGSAILILRRGGEKTVTLRLTAMLLMIVISTVTVCRIGVNLSSAYLLVPNMRGGQCVLLTARNTCIAVNCGGYGGEDTLQELLTLKQIRDIDLMILTDYNTTSYASLAHLMDHTPVRSLVLPAPGNEKDLLKAESIASLALEQGTSIRFAPCGDTPLTEQYATGALCATVISADTAAFDRGRLSVYLEAGKHAVLVTGNVSQDTLEKSAHLYGINDADVLALSPYYGRKVLPAAFSDPDAVYITTGYDGVTTEVQERFADYKTVFFPEYEKIILRFGL